MLVSSELLEYLRQKAAAEHGSVAKQAWVPQKQKTCHAMTQVVSVVSANQRFRVSAAEDCYGTQ